MLPHEIIIKILFMYAETAPCEKTKRAKAFLQITKMNRHWHLCAEYVRKKVDWYKAQERLNAVIVNHMLTIRSHLFRSDSPDMPPPFIIIGFEDCKDRYAYYYEVSGQVETWSIHRREWSALPSDGVIMWQSRNNDRVVYEPTITRERLNR